MLFSSLRFSPELKKKSGPEESERAEVCRKFKGFGELISRGDMVTKSHADDHRSILADARGIYAYLFERPEDTNLCGLARIRTMIRMDFYVGSTNFVSGTCRRRGRASRIIPESADGVFSFPQRWF
jgi:hypothetical protein